MNTKICLLLMCFIINSCGTERKISNTGIEEIQFGGGGGFTGQIEIYILSVDGRLFQKTKELKLINSKEALDLFERAKELKNYSFNEPENIYSFITIKTNEKTSRIVWTIGSDVDKRVIELHKKLMTTIK